MAEVPASHQNYRAFLTTLAKEGQARLEDQTQLELRRLINEFKEDPDRFRNRVEEKSESDHLLYKHPDPPLEIAYRIDRKRKLITFIDFACRALVGPLVVISYSHADKKWLDELKKFLKPLVRKKKIRIWDDTAIEAGDKWREEINRYFMSASLAIFLVSQDFIDSDFIWDIELPQLLDRAKKNSVQIHWIPVRPSTYKIDLVDLEERQALSNPKCPLSDFRRKSDREKELIKIREQIDEEVKQAILLPTQEHS